MPVELAVAVLPDGRSFVFEQENLTPAGAYPVGIEDVQGKLDFDAATAAIKEAAEKLLRALTSLSTMPEKCELSFGIKLNAVAGVVLAKAGAEANFSIKLSWSAGAAKA